MRSASVLLITSFLVGCLDPAGLSPEMEPLGVDGGSSVEPRKDAGAGPSDTFVEESGPVVADAASDVAPGEVASKSARDKVLGFFAGISGKRTLAGIHNRHNANPSEFTGRMHDVTGRYPAFWSADFLFESGDLGHRQDMIDQAKIEWTHGAVVQLMFHACPPDLGEPCNWDPGLLHHPLSDAQWADLVTEGGALNKAWKSRLDILVPFLKQLKDAGVAPLFRPLHEMNQGAFWWGGRKGAGGTRKLYQLTHDHLVKTRGLDHMIWVWDVQDLSSDFDQYNPGDAYYDIAALDVYDDGTGYTNGKYELMKKVSPTRPIAIGECQKLPTVDVLSKQPAWSFFMGWSELIEENNDATSIKSLFTAANVLTLDEMPGWGP